METMKAHYKEFIDACRSILGLSLPVSVRFRKGQKFREAGLGVVSAFHALYTARHKIVVASRVDDMRGNWRECVAHEFAHAWVDENHPKATAHGRTFQRTAAALRRALRGLGYDLKPFYLKGHDV